jgi:hypothetical protein
MIWTWFWTLVAFPVAALLCRGRMRVMWVLGGIGGLLNTLAIQVNGSKMPVLYHYSRKFDQIHVAMTPQTRWQWMCDVIPLGRPAWEIGCCSVGDLFLYVGMALAFWEVGKMIVEAAARERRARKDAKT